MGYPIPKRENEMRAKGSGPVERYQLTGEELARLRGQSPALPPTDSDGQRLKAPVAIKEKGAQGRPARTKPIKPTGLYDPEEQARRARARYIGKKSVPPLLDFLALIAAGKTIADVERSWGMSKNSLYYWVKKWQLIGINPGSARAELERLHACEGVRP